MEASLPALLLRIKGLSQEILLISCQQWEWLINRSHAACLSKRCPALAVVAMLVYASNYDLSSPSFPMSHISTGVEYGLHCLLYLSRSPLAVEEASVRDLAELQGIPAEFLAKLFTKLAKADLVVATEGIKGGFRLARPPSRITVYDVVMAIDGDKSLFECREIRDRNAVFEGCPPAWATRGVCGIHAIMQQAEKAMQAELKKHTLADIAERTLKVVPASHGGQIVEWLTDRAANRRSAR